jgi:uncharacterized protein (TIGR02145 family)
LAFTLSCSSDNDDGGNSSSSVGGGNVGAESVNINGQVWMKKNLDVAVAGSKCYEDDDSNCAKYGRLYNWATAMGLDASCNSSSCASQIQPKHRGICPEGWHIPSNAEWDALATYIEGDKGCTYCDAKHLKASSGWNENGNGTDEFEFAALPGGGGTSNGDFNYAGYRGLWWSASEKSANIAYFRDMDLDYDGGDGTFLGSDGKDFLFSVRCVRD